MAVGYCLGVMDVQTASRDELLAYLATLEAAVAALEARVRELEARGGEGAPRRMPGHKPEQRPEGPAPPRKRRAQGYGRRRSTPTEQVVHAVAAVPRLRLCAGGRQPAAEPRSAGTGARARGGERARVPGPPLSPVWPPLCAPARTGGGGGGAAAAGSGAGEPDRHAADSWGGGRMAKFSATWPACMGCDSVRGR